MNINQPRNVPGKTYSYLLSSLYTVLKNTVGRTRRSRSAWLYRPYGLSCDWRTASSR